MKKLQANKKVIGFDMDGVIVDYTTNKIRAAKKFGFNIKKEQTPSLVISAVLGSNYKDFKKYLYNDLVKSFKPRLMPNVKSTLNLIKRSGVVYFLISRQQNTTIVEGILKHHGLWPKYFNKQNTFFVPEPEDKEVKAKALGITHYIDDEPKILDVLISVKNKYLFDHLGVFKNSPYQRVKSWKEISKLI